MVDKNAIATQRQQLVEVKGIPGYMATKTGGEVSAEPGKVHDGGQKKPTILNGMPETANLVVTKPYRPAVHAAILRSWQKRTGELETTVSVYDTDPDLGRIATPQNVYAPAKLARVSWPEYDSASTDPGYFELEFVVDAT